MQMFGNILQIFLTIFLSLPWWMGRYVVLFFWGGEGENMGEGRGEDRYVVLKR